MIGRSTYQEDTMLAEDENQDDCTSGRLGAICKNRAGQILRLVDGAESICLTSHTVIPGFGNDTVTEHLEIRYRAIDKPCTVLFERSADLTYTVTITDTRPFTVHHSVIVEDGDVAIGNSRGLHVEVALEDHLLIEFIPVYPR